MGDNMSIDEIFKKARKLGPTDLESVVAKHVRMVLLKVLFSRGGVAKLSGPALKSGKKYDIYLSDDLEDGSEEQTEVFAHELLHVWIFEECGIEHYEEHESEISTCAELLAKAHHARLQVLLSILSDNF